MCALPSTRDHDPLPPIPLPPPSHHSLEMPRDQIYQIYSLHIRHSTEMTQIHNQSVAKCKTKKENIIVHDHRNHW